MDMDTAKDDDVDCIYISDDENDDVNEDRTTSRQRGRDSRSPRSDYSRGSRSRSRTRSRSRSYDRSDDSDIEEIECIDLSDDDNPETEDSANAENAPDVAESMSTCNVLEAEVNGTDAKIDTKEQSQEVLSNKETNNQESLSSNNDATNDQHLASDIQSSGISTSETKNSKKTTKSVKININLKTKLVKEDKTSSPATPSSSEDSRDSDIVQLSTETSDRAEEPAQQLTETSMSEDSTSCNDTVKTKSHESLSEKESSSSAIIKSPSSKNVKCQDLRNCDTYVETQSDASLAINIKESQNEVNRSFGQKVVDEAKVESSTTESKSMEASEKEDTISCPSEQGNVVHDGGDSSETNDVAEKADANPIIKAGDGTEQAHDADQVTDASHQHDSDDANKIVLGTTSQDGNAIKSKSDEKETLVEKDEGSADKISTDVVAQDRSKVSDKLSTSTEGADKSSTDAEIADKSASDVVATDNGGTNAYDEDLLIFDDTDNDLLHEEDEPELRKDTADKEAMEVDEDGMRRGTKRSSPSRDATDSNKRARNSSTQDTEEDLRNNLARRSGREDPEIGHSTKDSFEPRSHNLNLIRSKIDTYPCGTRPRDHEDDDCVEILDSDSEEDILDRVWCPPDHVDRHLVLRDLPRCFTESDFKRLVLQSGDIDDVYYNPKKRQGIVSFSNVLNAVKCEKQMENRWLLGSVVRVNFCEDPIMHKKKTDILDPSPINDRLSRNNQTAADESDDEIEVIEVASAPSTKPRHRWLDALYPESEDDSRSDDDVATSHHQKTSTSADATEKPDSEASGSMVRALSKLKRLAGSRKEPPPAPKLPQRRPKQPSISEIELDSDNENDHRNGKSNKGPSESNKRDRSPSPKKNGPSSNGEGEMASQVESMVKNILKGQLLGAARSEVTSEKPEAKDRSADLNNLVQNALAKVLTSLVVEKTQNS